MTPNLEFKLDTKNNCVLFRRKSKLDLDFNPIVIGDKFINPLIFGYTKDEFGNYSGQVRTEVIHAFHNGTLVEVSPTGKVGARPPNVDSPKTYNVHDYVVDGKIALTILDDFTSVPARVVELAKVLRLVKQPLTYKSLTNLLSRNKMSKYIPYFVKKFYKVINFNTQPDVVPSTPLEFICPKQSDVERFHFHESISDDFVSLVVNKADRVETHYLLPFDGTKLLTEVDLTLDIIESSIDKDAFLIGGLIQLTLPSGGAIIIDGLGLIELVPVGQKSSEPKIVNVTKDNHLQVITTSEFLKEVNSQDMVDEIVYAILTSFHKVKFESLREVLYELGELGCLKELEVTLAHKLIYGEF